MLKKNVELDGKTIFVTGAAGFIGSNLILMLMKNIQKVHIVGIDNMNDYYDVSLKEFRLNEMKELDALVSGDFTFIKGSIADKALINELFVKYRESGCIY